MKELYCPCCKNLLCISDEGLDFIQIQKCTQCGCSFYCSHDNTMDYYYDNSVSTTMTIPNWDSLFDKNDPLKEILSKEESQEDERVEDG